MRSAEPRITEVKTVVDELLRRINHWVDDDRNTPVVPESVAIYIRQAEIICRQGDVPESCLPLQTATARLSEEFRAYSAREHGKYRPENGAPGPSFWAACANLARSRVGAETPLAERLEPVATLLKQGVSHEQIAQHIYGRRGVGPFLQINGAADVGLIEKEAANPGSVIPADWMPPWSLEVVERQKEKLSKQLKVFETLETARKYDDPCTVEEMLQQGAFVQQIERAKGVSRDEVLAAAKRMGIEAVDGPGYSPQLVRDSGVGGIAGETISHNNGDGSSGVNNGDGSFDYSDPATDNNDGPGLSKDEMRELIISRYVKSDGQRGGAEIAAELRQEGHTVTSAMVAKTITHYKKRKQQEQQGLGNQGLGQQQEQSAEEAAAV